MNNDLVQVDGKFYKKHQVIMLPVEKGTTDHLWLDLKETNKLYKGRTEKEGKWQRQHLYITSDKEIKKGDWFVRGYRLLQATFNFGPVDNNNINIDKKILATTNSSLCITKQNGNLGQAIILLNRPSDAFIQKYIEEYNKGNVITDVMVEYEMNKYPDLHNVKEDLKVAPDNTITIKSVPESWDDIYLKWYQQAEEGVDVTYFKAWLKQNYKVPSKTNKKD